MLSMPGLFHFEVLFNLFFSYRWCFNFYICVSLVCTSFCCLFSLKRSCHLFTIFPFSMSSLPSFDLMPLVSLLFFPQSCLISWYTPLKWLDLAAFSALKATPSTFSFCQLLFFFWLLCPWLYIPHSLFQSFCFSVLRSKIFFCCFVIYLRHLCSVFAYYHNDLRRKLVDYIKCIKKMIHLCFTIVSITCHLYS